MAHDLRHTGNQLTANAGANPRERMARMGHDSERTALVYLHSPHERQRALADAVGEAARAELAQSKNTKKGPPKGLITISLRVLLKAGREVYTGYKTALI